MASILVDPDDISYIDEIDDDEDISEGGCEKRHKKRKNRIIHEALTINSSEPMVQELRQDRQRLLCEKEDNQTEDSIPSSANLLLELRKDRKQALQEKTSNQISDKTVGSTYEPNHAFITEAKEQSSKRRATEIQDQEVEVENVSDTCKLLKKDTIDGKNDKSSSEMSTLKPYPEQDIHYHEKGSNNTEQQLEQDLKNLKVEIQKMSPRSDIQSDDNLEDSNIIGKATGAQENKDEEIVKRKQISDAQILMIDEPSTSSASTEDFPTAKSKNKQRKRSGQGRPKSKTSTEMAGIQVYVTEPSEENSENDSFKKANGNVHGKSKSKSSHKSGKSETSTEISDEESSGLSELVNLNFLRRLSTDKCKDGASNDLLLKKALYEQSKTKPFKKMAKIKNGLFEVGIEGDVKRSYIKAMTIMPDKKLVMFDRSNGCLKLYDSDFNPLDRISVPVKYCGLTPIFDSSLVATFPEKKQLQFYHIDSATVSFQKERTQSISGEYYAIAHFDNKLYMLHRLKKHERFSDDKWAIHTVDMNKGSEEPVVLHKFCPGHKDNAICVTVDGVYMTNKLEGDILHLDHDGTFKYRGRLDMSLPMSITNDGQGNLFVCGGSINSFIEVFKSDLKGSKVIFNKKAQDLVAMCYDIDSNYLYVSDKISGRVLLYKIEHNGFVHGLMKSIITGSGISC